MDTEFGSLILENVDKLIDALEARPEDFVGEKEDEDEGDERETSDISHVSTQRDEIEEEELVDDFDEFGAVEEEWGEEEESMYIGKDADYLWDPEKLVEPPSNDLKENIAQLRKKIESIESVTANLFQVIEYLTKDPEIVCKLDEIEPFPLKNEKGALRRMVYVLEKKLRNLEKHQEEDEHSDHTEEPDSPKEICSGKRTRLKSTTLLDMFVDPKNTNVQLQLVYGDKTNGDIIHILKSDLIRMINQLDKWQEKNLKVIDSLKELKGCIPSEALCSCVFEVKLMKKAINIMTGGRFESGKDIIFLNPNRVGDLEKKLSDTGHRLEILEEVMQKLSEYDRKIKKIRKKFNPYLRSIIFDEPLPGECEQRDIGLDALRKRIQVIMASMQTITDISAQLLKSQEERDNRLTKIRKEIERLRYVKVDKEDVEDILTEKADPLDCNSRINEDEFVKLLMRIAQFNNSCTVNLSEKEAFWRRTAGEVRLECETKANKEDLEDAKKEIQSDVQFMIETLRDIRKAATRRRELSKNVEYQICASCGTRIQDTLKRSPAKYLSTHMMRHNKKKKWHGNEPQHSDIAQSMSGKRISKRHCGSSHTITTPEHRVERQIRPDCTECLK